jgi:hypothetical protein
VGNAFSTLVFLLNGRQGDCNDKRPLTHWTGAQNSIINKNSVVEKSRMFIYLKLIFIQKKNYINHLSNPEQFKNTEKKNKNQ